LFVKDESSRLGLPAFKILGASYAVSRALSARLGEDGALPLDVLAARLAGHPALRLVTATDGNHGRAVARVARLLGIGATILHPAEVNTPTITAIAGEGAEVIAVDGPYDDVVTAAAARAGDESVLVQDTAWPGYAQVPQWIVDGYTTMCAEIDDALVEADVRRLDLVVVPAGVGSLAQAVTQYYRGTSVHAPAVLVVEPDAAPAVTAALLAGRPVRVPTSATVMTGLNCGTISDLAWPVLRDGADGSVTVSEGRAIDAVRDLRAAGVDAGPCGAATLAAARVALGDPGRRADLGIGDDPVVVLVNTESLTANPLPEGADHA
jgi:diaminopropionate ammonia-lyase